MIVINKSEAAYLRNNLKDVCIYRTNKRKGGKWYAEASAQVIKLLNKFNENIKVIEEYPAK